MPIPKHSKNKDYMTVADLRVLVNCGAIPMNTAIKWYLRTANKEPTDANIKEIKEFLDWE